MRWALRWQGPQRPWVPPPPVTGSQPWPNVRQLGKVAFITALQSIVAAHFSHPAVIIIILQTHQIQQLSDLSDGFFSFCTLGIHPWCITCCLYGVTQRASEIYIANPIWQLIYILWQGISNRHHWLQALSSAFPFLGCRKDSFSPACHTGNVPSTSASCTNKERNTPQIALSISRREPPDIP